MRNSLTAEGSRKVSFDSRQVRSTLAKKLRNYLTDRQIGTWGQGSTRLVSQFANPSTQVELDRDGHDGNPLHEKPVGSPSSSPSSAGSEKHPRHLLRAAVQHQHADAEPASANLLVVTTLV